MKKILLATSAAICLATVASADVTFGTGSTTIEYGYVPDAPYSIINVGTNAAFEMGNWGFQLGSQINTYTDFTDSISITSLDMHFYRAAANGNKYGIYVNNISFAMFGENITEVGAEGMFSLGAVDIQTSLGVWLYDGPVDTGSFDMTAYYGIGDNIEVNAGISSIFQIGGSGFEAAYTVGASYAIPNSSLTAYADYMFLDAIGEGVFNVGLSFDFGPKSDERLFNHGSGILTGGFSL